MGTFVAVVEVKLELQRMRQEQVLQRLGEANRPGDGSSDRDDHIHHFKRYIAIRPGVGTEVRRSEPP